VAMKPMQPADPAFALSRPDGTEPNPKYVVPGLQRGLSVLALFGRDRRRLSLSEIGRLMNISRSAAFRLVYTLESMGLLMRGEEDDRYELGLGVLDLGFAALAAMDVVDVAERPLRALRDTTGGTIHLARRDGREIVYLLRFAAPAAMTTNVEVGTRLPAHATTLGRALLMDTNRADLAKIFGKGPLPAYTPSTARTIDALAEQLAQDRTNGFVLGNSIYEQGLDTVSVPIRSTSGRIVAAISAVGFGLLSAAPQGRDGVVQALLDTSAQISRQLIRG
jgi:DNA-binding IclR family transcriptional regulator